MILLRSLAAATILRLPIRAMLSRDTARTPIRRCAMIALFYAAMILRHAMLFAAARARHAAAFIRCCQRRFAAAAISAAATLILRFRYYAISLRHLLIDYATPLFRLRFCYHRPTPPRCRCCRRFADALIRFYADIAAASYFRCCQRFHCRRYTLRQLQLLPLDFRHYFSCFRCAAISLIYMPP